MHGFIHAQAFDIGPVQSAAALSRHLRWAASTVLNATYLALAVGLKRASRSLSGKPTHGITIDQASTQRNR